MISWDLIQESESSFILKIFYGCYLIEEHKIAGTEAEAEQKKSLHLRRLIGWSF
tara:strand:+ start:10169 stop:10330 length:162 start_codon:yes stop_codon:yes gene_type:complete